MVWILVNTGELTIVLGNRIHTIFIGLCDISLHTDRS